MAPARTQAKQDVSIVLCPSQVQRVLRSAAPAAAGSPSAADLIATLPAAGALARRALDPRLSRSLLRGLAILASIGAGGERERGIVELASELGMSASAAHRYAQTLVELGLLERSERTRKYRLPQR